MSTENPAAPLLSPVEPPLSMRDLAVVLVKHYGIREGCYDLMIEFQIGMGPVGSDPANLVPGAAIGLSRVGLIPSSGTGTVTVDAAIVNPAPAKATRTKTK